ncbi:hypothetical protein CASFOL_002023 [Castilleja foliolosa]|uniref:Uncharacterized protein n=1 Tax=Castilleja foliolosa TaxID=1961234 RepID=A0ABD3EF04_9LAMI
MAARQPAELPPFQQPSNLNITTFNRWLVIGELTYFIHGVVHYDYIAIFVGLTHKPVDDSDVNAVAVEWVLNSSGDNRARSIGVDGGVRMVDRRSLSPGIRSFRIFIITYELEGASELVFFNLKLL